MKITWLDNLVKEGHIRKEAQEAIYKDCADIVKIAKTVYSPKVEAFIQKATDITNSLMLPAAAMGGAYLASKMKDKVSLAKYKKQIDDARMALKADPEFARYQEKVQARLEDMAVLAPSLLINKDLTKKIIKEKIHSGFSPQDVQNLALIQAVYGNDISALKGLTSVAAPIVKKASLSQAGETLAAMAAMVKEAGINASTLGRTAENMLLLSAIPVLGGIGAGIVRHVADTHDKKKLKEKLRSSFNQAMETSGPDHILSANKDKAEQAFQTLAHFSPHVALNPTAAKSFMTKLVEWSAQGPQIEDIKHLSEIERNIRGNTRMSPFFEGLSAGSKALGLDNALRSSTTGIANALNDEIAEMARHDIG